MTRAILPRLYVIVDLDQLSARRLTPAEVARGLRAAGVGLVQLRDKSGDAEATCSAGRALREALGPDCLLVLNDRVDLAMHAEFDGVHVGQGDTPVVDARLALGPNKIIGLSTHTGLEVRAADASAADYVAIGPVFATGTKLDAAPVVGLEEVRRARALTKKPLVAIGGITAANARSVIDAGADSVAVISALFVAGRTVEQAARDLLRILGSDSQS